MEGLSVEELRDEILKVFINLVDSGIEYKIIGEILENEFDGSMIRIGVTCQTEISTFINVDKVRLYICCNKMLLHYTHDVIISGKYTRKQFSKHYEEYHREKTVFENLSKFQIQIN